MKNKDGAVIMEKINDMYSKPLTDFFEQCLIEVDSIPNGMPSIFIPGVGENYLSSKKKKILYIGIDTNEWFDLKKEVFKYSENKQEFIKDYLGYADKGLHDLCHAKEWYNKNSQFWKFIMKLQMKLHNPAFELSKLDQCLKDDQIEDYRTILTSFAWGNCNAIQCLRDSAFDKKNYQKIKGFSSEFDHLSTMTKALKPDVVIILNWGENESFIQPQDDPTLYECKQERMDGKVKVFHYKAKDGEHPPVIWSYHPQWMVRREDIDTVVEYILRLEPFQDASK